MNRLPAVILLCLPLSLVPGYAASSLRISGFDRSGLLTWTDAPTPGVCTLEAAGSPGGPWAPVQNSFATSSAGTFSVPVDGTNQFHRLLAVDVSATPQGFTNLVQSYGLLETVAGNGMGQTDGVNYWTEWYEGWPATAVPLSRPHFAMADGAGNIYIVDKNSHSVLKVAPEGTTTTYAGNHVGGFNGEGPASATNLELNLPNGLWVSNDGTVYVLDTGNGRVRRVDTNGMMTTLFLTTADGSALSGGRGLWVNENESLAYFGAETRIRTWEPSGGLQTVASGFTELGNLYVEPGGDILACDRGAHYVYRVTVSGKKTIIAGNGTTGGGGDGFAAVETGLNGVRGIWPVPTGGYLLLTHQGCQLWYMDTAGIIRLLLNGAPGRTHNGDGLFFYSGEPAISEGRSVTMDQAGNILVCESDYGFVRKIRFDRLGLQ